MSKLIVDGNEVFPGTITITDNNSTITPKDDLRVILNISRESTVTLSDGTDVTQRVEVFNASADNCTLGYVSSAGNSTTVLASHTSIRLLWVGTFWDYNDKTTITGIDDNGQPFAYNIDSLVEPKGVINITGTDANGNSFDYGLGKLVLAADEDNLVTGVEVKTSKTYNGEPVYKKEIKITNSSPQVSTDRRLFQSNYTKTTENISHLISCFGFITIKDGDYANNAIMLGGSGFFSSGNTMYASAIWDRGTYLQIMFYSRNDSSWSETSVEFLFTIEYTKTTD